MTFAIEALNVEKRYGALPALAVVGVSFVVLSAATLLLRSGYKLRQ